jgi:hypothetical protein
LKNTVDERVDIVVVNDFIAVGVSGDLRDDLDSRR